MTKIAIDVGGVLIAKKHQDGQDTNFDPDDIKWLPGAIEAVRTLVTQGHECYILSFCGKKTEEETRVALHKEIAVSIPENRWIFTRKREHKLREMEKLGITILIDDSDDIIQLIRQNNRTGILFHTWANVMKEF